MVRQKKWTDDELKKEADSKASKKEKKEKIKEEPKVDIKKENAELLKKAKEEQKQKFELTEEEKQKVSDAAYTDKIERDVDQAEYMTEGMEFRRGGFLYDVEEYASFVKNALLPGGLIICDVSNDRIADFSNTFKVIKK